MNEYWAKRQAKAQENLTNKTIKQTEAQLKKYYQKSMRTVIAQFEDTYNKLLLTIAEGRDATPADLYKLDRYWQLQGQLRVELQRLGDKQAVIMSKNFMEEFHQIYEVFALKDDLYFGKIDTESALKMINEIWCADGKSWSQRIWQNISELQQALNDELITCVTTGKKTTELKNLLQERFNVSYNRADSIVRTEMAHIQTQAARKRYEDSNVREVEVYADDDERRCEICGKLHGKKYLIGAQMPIPAHPRCRCCILPVIDID